MKRFISLLLCVVMCMSIFTATAGQVMAAGNASNIFTVTNTSTLIQTGQLIWPIPVLAAGGMLFIAVGITLLQKKRKTNA